MTLSFKSNIKTVLANLDTKSRKVNTAAHEALDRTGIDWEREMKLDRFTGYYEGLTQGSRLRNRSGALASSPRYRVSGSKLKDMVLIVTVGSGAAGYANVQETGKPRPIRPKRRKYLRVPLPAALTPAGVVRAESKPINVHGRRWIFADGKRAFIHRGPKGAVIMRDDGGGESTPMFALKGSITIKPRLGAKRTLTKVIKRNAPRIAEAIVAVLGRRAR